MLHLMRFQVQVKATKTNRPLSIFCAAEPLLHTNRIRLNSDINNFFGVLMLLPLPCATAASHQGTGKMAVMLYLNVT